MRRTALAVVFVLSCLGVARSAEPIPYEIPKDATRVMDRGREIGHGIGLKTNLLTVLSLRGEAPGGSPVSVDNEFRERSVKTPEDWAKIRDGLKKKLVEYFGEMPPLDAPLDAKVEKTEDRGDHVFKLVTVAFDKEHRGEIGLLIPKGIPTPSPAIVLWDGNGGGIDRACSGVYSRAIALHFVRDGLVIAALNHWDEKFGTSRKLCTAGAATHMLLRTCQFLKTQKELVDPDRIGYWGYVYGADLIPFFAGFADDIKCFVASNCVHTPVAPYTAAFWGPPFWARQGDNMGIASRNNPKMYYSGRDVSISPLPFLTQEIMAMPAPRPFLAIITAGEALRGASAADVRMFTCIWPVWKLYGKGDLLEVIGHKWGNNEPVNARDYTVDFFMRTLYGINPGKAPDPTVKQILDGLRSNKADEKLKAARLANWWRCKEATKDLVACMAEKDTTLRYAAAKALTRVGAMKELLAYIKDPDPMIRVFVVEAMQICGTEEAFDTLLKNDSDTDRWANEAKWQTLQVNPWE